MDCDNCKNIDTCRFVEEGRIQEYCRFYIAKIEAKSIDETPKQVSQNICEWLEVKEADGIMYETDCENGFICGDYERLDKDYKYCPYCGKPIKIKRGKQ